MAAPKHAPHVVDPAARACLAAASCASTAIDYLLCAVREGEPPNREEIVVALSSALHAFLSAYPGDDAEVVTLHSAACEVLGEDVPDCDLTALDDTPDLLSALRAMVGEWEKFSRYGSPIAKAANEAVNAAKAAIAKAEGRG